jgi:hypothetical protein
MKDKKEPSKYPGEGLSSKGAEGTKKIYMPDVAQNCFYRSDLGGMPVFPNASLSHSYEAGYLTDAGQFQHYTGMSSFRNEMADAEYLKHAWKKEKNRLAAKKSREKKLVHLRELERKEHIMVYEIAELKSAVTDYDAILKNMLDYIQECLKRRDKKNENFVLLFDCLCRLKKAGTEKPTYLHDVSHLLEEQLQVTNDEIERISNLIRESLNDLFDKSQA